MANFSLNLSKYIKLDLVSRIFSLENKQESSDLDDYKNRIAWYCSTSRLPHAATK
jgi:hypothetical protein